MSWSGGGGALCGGDGGGVERSRQKRSPFQAWLSSVIHYHRVFSSSSSKSWSFLHVHQQVFSFFSSGIFGSSGNISCVSFGPLGIIVVILAIQTIPLISSGSRIKY